MPTNIFCRIYFFFDHHFWYERDISHWSDYQLTWRNITSILWSILFIASFVSSLSFSAILSLWGFHSLHYRILNTSFTKILAPVEKQAGKIRAGYAFLWYKAVIYGPHRGRLNFFLFYIFPKGGNTVLFSDSIQLNILKFSS